MYSRYVPLLKGKLNPAQDLNSNIAESLSRTSPASAFHKSSIQPDASNTYSRYIPPSSKSESLAAPIVPVPFHESALASSKRRHEHIEDPSPESAPRSKRKKKSKDVEIGGASLEREISTLGSCSISNNHELGSSKFPMVGEVEKKTKKNKGDSAQEHFIARNHTVNGDDFPEGEDAKHKSILSRRAKSLKKAKKIAALLGDQIEAIEPTAEELLEIHPLQPLPQPEPIPEPTATPSFSALPAWLSNPIRASPNTTAPFAEFGIQKEVIKILHSKGFKDAFAVQAAVLPLLLPGDRKTSGDVLVSAATGSGKTLAYVLPMVQDISLSTVTRLRGLIVMPTRELVTQVRKVCEICATAFATSNRRVKIGIAVGNQQLKAEQTSLMNEGQRYDPEEYIEQQRRINAKWESSSVETGEDVTFYEEEAAPTLPDHVLEYTPKIDILICTPGRLVEHLKSTPGFTLDLVKWLVIDEADKLLDQSFQQWLEAVMARLARGNRVTGGIIGGHTGLTKVVLSATITRDIGQLSALKLQRPKFVVLKGSEESSEDLQENSKPSEALSLPCTLKELAIKVEESDKPLYLLELLRAKLMEPRHMKAPPRETSEDTTSSSSDDDTSEDDFSTGNFTQNSPERGRVAYTQSQAPTAPRGILIFTKSNENAVRLSRLLQLLEPGYTPKIGTLTSTIRNSIRRHTLRDFQAGKVSILIASDLVSRGLDLPDLAHVVNYDMPASLTSYIHRVGRTARAGKDGCAWTLFTNSEARWFWNEIARSEAVLRNKVGRFNGIDGKAFGEETRRRYENALAELGREAAAVARY